MNFLTLLLAIIIVEGYGELAFIQRDEWVRKWHQGLARLSFLKRSSNLKIAAFILIPAVVLHLVLAALANSSDDLRDEVFAALPYRIFERSFAVVFWFFFLGAPVALCYRLLALYGDLDLENSAADIEEELNNPSPAGKLLWLLEWIPVRLLCFTIGLVGSFSHTMAHLRELIFCSDTGAAELLRRCVNGALGESASDNIENAALSKAAINTVTSLFRRAMTAWLVGIAILVILS
jgi:AmpE protein